MPRLLLEAIESLPEPDRRLVLEHLIDCALVTSRRPAVGGARGGAEGGSRLHVQESVARDTTIRHLGTPGPAGQRLVPVRFPEEQHLRLKEWCARNGFSMAVVIRGLIDRFLDEYDPRDE